MRGSSSVTLAAFAARALADTHTLYAGFFAGTTLVRLEFDDSTNALTLVENITAPNTSGQKWIALDVCLYSWLVHLARPNLQANARRLVTEAEPIRSHDRLFPGVHHRG